VHAVITTVICLLCGNITLMDLHLHSVPVQMGVDGQPVPESVPLSIVAPGLPSYNEALTHSGQHDAPPPPYSG